MTGLIDGFKGTFYWSNELGFESQTYW